MTTGINRVCGLFALAACLVQAACEAGDENYRRAWEPLPPVALGTQVAFVERTSATAFMLDPAMPGLRPRSVALAQDPVVAVRRNGQDELLVLARGERGGPGIAPSAPQLAVIAADDGKPLRTLTASSRFNALAQSDDGRFVITHFARNTAVNETLFNPNEIAIADLRAQTPLLKAKTLRSFGSVPLGVVFSPRLTLPEGDRTLAVVLSENYVTLVDLDNPERPETTVQLTLPDDKRTLIPQQVLFDTKTSTVFVRAAGANDVYALTLAAVPVAERSGNDFRPALSLLAVGSSPSDMALYEAADGPRLVVVSPGSQDVFVVDARSSRTTRIPMEASANRITIFDAVAPGDPKIRKRALLLDTNQGSRQVAFLTLDRIEEQGTRNLDTRSMAVAGSAFHVFPDRGVVVVLHGPVASGGPGLSVIDLASRTVAPIFAEIRLSGVTLGQPGSGTVWIAANAGTRLGFLGLKNLQVGEVRLDAPVEAVFPLEKSKDGHSRLVVVHPGVAGDVTILDAEVPDRATARSARGFLTTDLLQRGAP